jgi:hypothetical protein
MLWSKAIGAGGFGGLNPADFFGPSDQGFFVDTFDPANRTGTTTASSLIDLSPNGNDLVTESGAGPSVTTVGGNDYLDIAGSGLAMTNTDTSWISVFNNQITFCAVVIPGGSSEAGNNFWAPNITIADMRELDINNVAPFSAGKGSNKPWLGVTSNQDPGSEWLNAGSDLVANVPVVFSFTIDGNSVKIYLNDSLDSSATFTAPGLSRSGAEMFTLGARRLNAGTIDDYWDGQIGPSFLISRVLTSTELSLLQQKYIDLIS